MENKILRIESDKSGSAVEIILNKEGIDYLIDILSHLKAQGVDDHVHLMTPSWGGKELNEEILNDHNELIHQAKIIFIA